MTESNRPLFYKQVVALNKKQHGSARIEPVHDYHFAVETNSIYVAAIEFGRAMHEYPIVFGRDSGGNFFPVAVLGLRNNENLYVDSEGKWQAEYIPAYVRRYPFILATTEQQDGQTNFTVCIDEAYAGFAKSGEQGQPLFDDAGNESELLQNSVKFLKEYQGHVQLTRQFCQNLVDLELLETMRADIAMASGEKHVLGGFLCVNRDKLKKLPAEKLAELANNGQLELIYAHLLSMANLNSLIKRIKSPVEAKKLN